eukprot:m.73436 g.73436  ORF g.73436 m.73436 type:complete len:1107 (-) comp13036_c3_seq2:17-3337(-)
MGDFTPKLGTQSEEQAVVSPLSAPSVGVPTESQRLSFHIPDQVLEKAPDSTALPAAQSGLLDTGVLPSAPAQVAEPEVGVTAPSANPTGTFDQQALARRLTAAAAADAAAHAAAAAAAVAAVDAAAATAATSSPTSPSAGAGAGATPGDSVSTAASPARSSGVASPPRSILKTSGAKSSRPLVWTAEVRLHSRDARGQVHNVDDCVAAMREGAWLTKIRGSKALARHIRYDPEARSLAWPSARSDTMRYIPLIAIERVVRGKRCKAFHQKKLLGAEPRLCFSIVHRAGGKLDELALIAETENTCRQWIVGMRQLLGEQASAHAYPAAFSAWLAACFNEADADHDGRLNESEARVALSRLLPRDTPEMLARNLASFNEVKRGLGAEVSLTLADLCELQARLCSRCEIVALLDEYASPAAQCLTRAQLKDFLSIEQQVFWVTDEYADELIDLYEPTQEGRRDRLLGTLGFTRMLTSSFPAAASPPPLDTSLPLTSFFVAASHNTFLLKDQLKGPSGPEGYTAAIARGCRVVDVDVWDGDNGPCVYNGYTVSGRIALREALTAIASAAFTTTDLPLLIYFENHCGLAQQAAVAAEVQEILGPLLYRVDAAQLSLPLPPLAELRGRVLLISKRLPANVEGDAEVSEDDEAEPHDARRKKRNKGRASSVDGLDPTTPKQPYRLSSALSSLVALPSVRLDETLARRREPWTVSSIDDNKAVKVAEANSGALVEFTSERLLRVYPSALRVNSDNFESPMVWTHGAQIVAMNTQTQDLPLRTHWGLFHQSPGFALKPRRLRRRFTAFCPEQPGLNRTSPKKLTVEVISAQHLPLPESSRQQIVDPFVCVAIDGLPCDASRQTTKAVDNNAIDPMFGETFSFSVGCPDIALLSFIVLDDSRIGDNFIGQFSCPLRYIQPGYRHAPLSDRHGVPVPGCSLFVKISIAGSYDTSIPGLVYASASIPSLSALPAAEAVASSVRTLQSTLDGAAAAVLLGAQKNNIAAALERLSSSTTLLLSGSETALVLESKNVPPTAKQLHEAVAALLTTSQHTLAECTRLENDLDAAVRNEAKECEHAEKLGQLYGALDAARDGATDCLVAIKAAVVKSAREQHGL